jgi:cellulose synthase/poly-beta-1,6-N-acetylglucosamine synthase-like glycosyltransferase
MSEATSEGQAEQPTIEVSVVVTVRNEAGSIGDLLAALAEQTVRPREIVIVDGGSTDQTVAVLREWQGRLPLQIIEAPGASISRGRNLGIAATQCPIVAVTDAGTRPAPGWLAAITARLLKDTGAHEPAPDVVSGWFVADPRTVFEEAMGATVLPTLNEIEPAAFLPSSRSIAFRREAWQAVGGYPEWLDYCEDLVFDLALREAGYRFAFVPAALVRFRPRSTLRAFWHQYFRYARGDGKAGLWRRRHLIRYGTYSGALAVLVLGRRRGRRGLAVAGLALLPGAVAHLWRPYARLLPRLRRLGWRDGCQAAALVPIIRLVGDLAKMAGYPAGLWWRARPLPSTCPRARR